MKRINAIMLILIFFLLAGRVQAQEIRFEDRIEVKAVKLAGPQARLAEAEETEEGPAFRKPNDTLYPQQKNLLAIGFPLFYQQDPSGYEGIPIVLVDTGVWDHPDLKLDCDQSRSFVSDPNPCIDPGSNGHGTLMAGFAAARTDNSEGIAGISGRSPVISFRIFEPKTVGETWYYHSTYEITSRAFEALLEIEEPRFVVNCSFMVNLPPDHPLVQTMQHVMRLLRDRAIFVSAVGNNHQYIDPENPHIYPAGINEPNHIVVGSIGEFGEITNHSNYGSIVDVVSPHQGITTSNQRDNQLYVDIFSGGTSSSTAHTSGVVATIWSQFPEADTGQVVRAVLEGTAPAVMFTEKAGFPPGIGSLNIPAAYKKLRRILDGEEVSPIQVSGVVSAFRSQNLRAENGNPILSPGSLVSIYGTNFLGDDEKGSVEIWLNGAAVRLKPFYEGRYQVNLQTPEDLFRIRSKDNRWAIVRLDELGAIEDWELLPSFDAGLNPGVAYGNDWWPVMTFAKTGEFVTDTNAPQAGDDLTIFLTGIVKNPGNPYGVPEIVEGMFLHPNFENPEEVFPVIEIETKETLVKGVYSLTFTIPEGVRPAGYVAWMKIQVGDQVLPVNFPLREPPVEE